MKKYIISSLVAIALVFSVVTPACAATIAELQAMVAQLLQQIATMQAQNENQSTGGGGGSSDRETLSVNAQFVANTENKVGVWDVFIPGKGRAGGGEADWRWDVTITNNQTETKIIKKISILHESSMEGWSTDYEKMYGSANGYPLLVKGKEFLNTKYVSELGVKIVPKGSPTLQLYGQPESSAYRGATMNIYFTDGSMVALKVPVSGSAGAVISKPRSGGGGSVSGTINTNLAVGSTGADVVKLQNFLESKGFLAMEVGQVKGYFGASTKAAVMKYQAAVGMPATGFVGPETRAKINASLGGGDSVDCTKITPSISDIRFQSNVNAVTVPTKSVYVGDVVKIEWQGRCLDSFNVTLRDIKGKEVYKTIDVPAFKSGAFWTVTEADYNKDEYVTIHIETTDGKYKQTTSKIAISKRTGGTNEIKPVIKLISPKTGDKLVLGKEIEIKWETQGFLPTDYVTITGFDSRRKCPEGDSSCLRGYDNVLSVANTGSYKWKVDRPGFLAFYPMTNDPVYTFRISSTRGQTENSKSAEYRTGAFSIVESASTAVESYISSESRLGSGSDITLRPGVSETVYGIRYKVSGNPVVIERVDVDLIDQKENRNAADYISSIQLLDMNQRLFATLLGTAGDSDDDTTSYRFTGLNYRLENDGGYYIRINTKSSLPNSATYDVVVPKNGVRYVDGTVSDTFGNASIVREVQFVPSSVINTPTIPLNSPDYQRMEISLPNGTKQVIYEKKGTSPAPRILSLSKTAVAAGETITIETQNVGVVTDTTVYFDTFKGNRYEAKAKATNTATGGQKLVVSVSPSFANGQYYVYLSTENGTSNYKGLTVQSGQGANVYSSIQELLNKISQELANQ